MSLSVIATIQAKPEALTEVRAELIKLIVPSRADAGCISYVLHQDQSEPCRFYFLECWESKVLLDAHLNQPHLAAFVAATEGKLAKMDIALADMIG